jgi:spermidine synthase
LPGREQLWLSLHGSDSSLAMAREDATSVVAIVPWPASWHVVINGKHHSQLPFGGLHTRLGALPALMHPRPERIAIVGLGSGDTAWAAACREQTRELTVFEIARPLPALLARLADRERLPDLAALLADPRLSVRFADGRHALEARDERYDLVEADALWPYAAYSGNLYSVEFFRACARRLEPGGFMCTWSPTPRVEASFHAAFAHVVGPGTRTFLIGSNQPIRIDTDAWRARLASPAVEARLGPTRTEDLLRALVRIALLEAPASVAPDRDLYPRDEFLTP